MRNVIVRTPFRPEVTMRVQLKSGSELGESREPSRGHGRQRVPGSGPQFQLRLLDGFHLDHDGQVMGVPHSVRRLLAFLGVHGRTGRVEIAGTLWPEVVEARAHASLRTVLWRLHRLAPGALVAGRETLALTPAVSVDVSSFVAAARRVLGGDDDAAAGDGSPLPPFTAMGELLPGWYEDWVLFERERLRQLHMHALEALAARLTQARRYAEAIEAALAAVRLEPLRESATRALISAYLAENNVVEAVRRFESFRDELTNELGAQPTPDLERLVRSGLSQTPVYQSQHLRSSP
jgi:DNA-binding SARP family transcriptional activator